MAGVSGKTGTYIRTKEMLANYSHAATSRNYTPEGRKKISEERKKRWKEQGHNCLGKHWKFSEEARERRLGKPGNHLGHKHNKETRKKLSTLKIEQYKSSPRLRELARSGGVKGILKQAAQKEPTSIEKAVYDYLVCKGIIFEKQVNVGNRFVVDAYIPSLNIVIEADGTYWHSTPRGIETDKRKNEYLNEKKYKLIRLSEDEIRDGSFIEKLKEI